MHIKRKVVINYTALQHTAAQQSRKTVFDTQNLSLWWSLPFKLDCQQQGMNDNLRVQKNIKAPYEGEFGLATETNLS